MSAKSECVNNTCPYNSQIYCTLGSCVWSACANRKEVEKKNNNKYICDECFENGAIFCNKCGSCASIWTKIGCNICKRIKLCRKCKKLIKNDK